MKSMDHVSYLGHLIQDKPFMVLLSGITASLTAYFVDGWVDQVMTVGAVLALSLLDLLTKLWACKRNGVPITSLEMRSKGLPKLRDYLILYIAGALTLPLMPEPWGYRAVLFSIAMWELWSIAENLHDGGSLPFDVRRLQVFRTIRSMARRDDDPLH